MMLVLVAASLVVLVLSVALRRRPASPLPDEATTAHACGSLNPPGANFCRRCGEALTLDLVAEDDPPETPA
jgi:hypothetical protein